MVGPYGAHQVTPFILGAHQVYIWGYSRFSILYWVLLLGSCLWVLRVLLFWSYTYTFPLQNYTLKSDLLALDLFVGLFWFGPSVGLTSSFLCCLVLLFPSYHSFSLFALFGVVSPPFCLGLVSCQMCQMSSRMRGGRSWMCAKGKIGGRHKISEDNSSKHSQYQKLSVLLIMINIFGFAQSRDFRYCCKCLSNISFLHMRIPFY